MSIMSLPSEVDTLIIPQPGAINSGNNDVKIAEKSRQCPICHVYYKYGNSYWQHVRYVHARFLSQCVICEKSYKRTTMAKHHILHSHKIAWHLCGNYVRKIKKSDLPPTQDVKTETDKGKTNLKYYKKKTLHLISCFNCYDCPASFATIDELFEHVKSHKGEENYDEYDEYEEADDVETNKNEEIIDEVQNNNVVENDDVVENDVVVQNNDMVCNEGSQNGDIGVDDSHVLNGINDTD